MRDRARQRRDLRRRRRALDPEFRLDAALSIARYLTAGLLLRRISRLAGYVAADAEADPGPFLAAARFRKRRVYLPVVGASGSGRLRFTETGAGQPLSPNRFGIPEPLSGAVVSPLFLDLVLVPLVGVDDQGNRIGMGAGFYDRTFQFLNGRAGWRKPRLVGVAYECQRVARLAPSPWDVPLDAVVTEAGLHWFNETE